MHVVDSSRIRNVAGERPSPFLGGGVFETMRVRQTGPGQWFIVGFDRHCERLIIGARAFGLVVPSVEALKEAAAFEVESAVESVDLILRFVAEKYQVLVFAEKYVPHPWISSGVSLKTVRMTRPFPKFKHSSALVSIESDRKAKEAGYDTALLVEEDGRSTECSWASFFWLSREGEVCTNTEEVLPGVTQALLSAFVSVNHKPLTIAAILGGECTAAFISQATSGVVPVVRIDSLRFSAEQMRACEELISPFKQALVTCEIPGTLLGN